MVLSTDSYEVFTSLLNVSKLLTDTFYDFLFSDVSGSKSHSITSRAEFYGIQQGHMQLYMQ
jgi:hypothetical protein